MLHGTMSLCPKTIKTRAGETERDRETEMRNQFFCMHTNIKVKANKISKAYIYIYNTHVYGHLASEGPARRMS